MTRKPDIAPAFSASTVILSEIVIIGASGNLFTSVSDMGLTRILVDVQLALSDFVDSYIVGIIFLTAMIVIISASTCSWLHSILPIFAYRGEDEVNCMFQEEHDDSEYATDRLFAQ